MVKIHKNKCKYLCVYWFFLRYVVLYIVKGVICVYFYLGGGVYIPTSVIDIAKYIINKCIDDCPISNLKL